MSAITAKASRKMKKYAVLTREPRCFLGSFDFSWEQRKFSDITFPAGEKNKDNLPLESYSITNEHGFVPQDEKFENGGTMREADKRMYYIVSPNSFAYNPARINVGSIGYQNIGKNVIVSSLYEVFKTSEDVDDRLLWHWFKSPDFQKLIMQLQEGGVRLYFYYDKLCMGEVSLPSLEEQRKIGKLFDTLDNLITLHQRKCANLCSPSQVVFSLLFATSTFSWEQRKLSEITDKVTEKNAGLQYVETFTNSAEFGIISQRDFFDHDIAKLGSLDGYYIVKKEDFVYNPRISTSAPVGPINRNKLGRTGVMSPLYTVFRPHDIDTTYLEYFFKCGYWHSFMNFNGDSGARSDRFSIRDNVFFQMPIPIPDIDEQRKIGELLTCLDNLITLHQRECISFTGRADRLILTANKKRTTSSWEQRKVSELFRVTRGYVLAATQTETTKTDEKPYPVYSSQTKDKGLMGYYKDYLYEDAITWTTDGANAGTVNYRAGKFYCTNVCGVLLSNEVKANQMIAEALNSVAKGYVSYVGNPKLMNNVMADIVIQIPTQAEEREQLSSFFAKLDNLITLHQRKPFLMKWRTSDANRNQTNRLVL